MEPNRGFVRRWMLAILACLYFALPANALAWPDKPVRFLVATPPGTGPDVVARLVGERLGALWGQQVVVDNRAGAGGIPAMSSFVRSDPDGHSFAVLHTAVIALTPHLFKQPRFDVDADVVTVSTLVESPLLVAVNPKLGVSTMQDLVKAAKAQPGKLVFAAPLPNSVPHLTSVLLSRALGIDYLTVPYNGSGASTTATIAGDGGDFTIDAPAALIPNVKAGKLKAIAVTSLQRLPTLDVVPTVAETVKDFQAIGWFALFAPAHTKPDVIERVNRDVAQVLKQPDLIGKLADLGLYPHAKSPKESAAFVLRERARWLEAVRQAGIKPE